MKSIFYFITLIISASTALACDDFSGTYVSTDANMAKQIYKISQNGCNFKIELNNAGSDVDPDILRADGQAYDLSSRNYDKNGHVMNPFLPATPDSASFVRMSNPTGSLVISQLYGNGSSVANCKEEYITKQPNCSFIQRVFTKSGNQLIETFNGYMYSDGQHRPYSYHFIKTN